MKYILRLTLVCIVTSLLFCSCGGKKKIVEQGDILQLEIHSSDKNKIPQNPQTWHVTNKKICILFGHGFNESEIYTEIINELSERYGLAENGGLIYPLVYPDSFKHGSKGYVNDFVLELENEEIDFAGVITLGAPDRTHVSLARFQDFWKQNVPCVVVALYPQDDVLGIEATSDIVIEKAQVADMTGTIVEEAGDTIDISDVSQVVASTVGYIQYIDSSLKKDANLQKHVQQMLKNKKLHRYSDPETGLQSVNHFVLY